MSCALPLSRGSKLRASRRGSPRRSGLNVGRGSRPCRCSWASWDSPQLTVGRFASVGGRTLISAFSTEGWITCAGGATGSPLAGAVTAGGSEALATGPLGFSVGGTTGASAATGAAGAGSGANGLVYSRFGVMTETEVGWYATSLLLAVGAEAGVARLPRARPEPRLLPNEPVGWVSLAGAAGVAALSAAVAGAVLGSPDGA